MSTATPMLTPTLDKDLMFLLLQYLDEEKYQESLHKLEQESASYFNMNYFEEKIMAGDWDEVERYLSGFTKLGENQSSMAENRPSTIPFYFIRRQKYLEALDQKDMGKAVHILRNELSIFFGPVTYEGLDEHLITLDDFREDERFRRYDIIKDRRFLVKQLKKVIEANPVFLGKLDYPVLEKSRLRDLVNQSLSLQNSVCEYPQKEPSNSTLYTDHTCDAASAATPGPPPVAKPATYAPLPFPTAAKVPNAKATATATASSFPQPAVGVNALPELTLVNHGQPLQPSPSVRRMANATTSSVDQAAFVTVLPAPTLAKQVSMLKRQRSPPNFSYQKPEHKRLTKHLQSFEQAFTDKAACSTDRKLQWSKDDLLTNEGRELVEIAVPSKCRVVALPDSRDHFSKVARLLYTNSGNNILVIGSNGIQRIWKWNRNEKNPNGKATASVVPLYWQPRSGLHMTNDVSDNLEKAVPCIALSKNDAFVVSACGGKIKLFNMMTSKVVTTFMLPALAPSFLVFYPQDNNVVAIGMEDSTIYIYNAREEEVKTVLKGHRERITGLTFSTNLNVLVSSGADAQVCTWNVDTWEKQKAITIQVPAAKVAVGDTQVQLHSDQIRLLVSHETQLSIYDASTMKCIHQWVPREVLSTRIAYAAYSCNGQIIYAAFHDGDIGVFDNESLRLRCRIAPSAYLSKELLNSPNVRPVVIATHPQEPNQIAVGLTDGTVKVLEPSESDGEWLVTSKAKQGCR